MGRRWVWGVAGLLALVLLAGATVLYFGRSQSPVGIGPAGSRGPSADGIPRSSAPTRTVRYDFDKGLGPAVLDEAGRLPLLPSAAAGGELSTQRHGNGLAVRFPAVCPIYGDQNCPRAILETGPAPDLNPGAAAIRFGATVLVAAEETTIGGNVLQKGYSVGSSQFKLQVDGLGGKPSCVVVGAGDPTIHVAVSSLTVANGQWHVVECVRTADVLTITVDGRIAGRSNVPTHLSIMNSEPLRIGGKGTSANNDQFHGAIDDAFVAIGA